MKYLKIFSMIFLSIAMLISIALGYKTFLWVKLIGPYYIPSFIILIGFVFLLIYIARTKNIYSLVASLFLTTSILILVSNMGIPFLIMMLYPVSKSLEITIYVVSAVISFIFIVTFTTLSFFFKSKSKKYILVK